LLKKGYWSQRGLIPTFFLLLALLIPSPSRATGRLLHEPVFDGQVYIEEQGESHPELLLLVHGLGDEAGHCWDDLLQPLSERYHVLVPDLPGFGRSSHQNRLYSPENYALFLTWLVSRWPDKPLILVGHSLGGAISLTYAARQPERLQRLVLVDSVGLLHRLALSQQALRQQLPLDLPRPAKKIETVLGRVSDFLLEKASRLPLSPALVLPSAELRRQVLNAEPSRIAALALVESDFSLRLGRVEIPTMLLWGSEDRVAPLRIAQALQWRLLQAELRILAGRGHSPMLEKPKEFLPWLLGAIRELPRRPATPPALDELPDGRCDQQQGMTFSGHYNHLLIKGCQKVRLEQVEAQKMILIDSEAEMTASRVVAKEGPALEILRSRLKMTGVDLQGPTGLVIDQSRIDALGVQFDVSGKAVQSQGHPSAVIFSSSVIERPEGMTGLHLSRSLKPGESL